MSRYPRRYNFLHPDPLVTAEVNRSYDCGYDHGAEAEQEKIIKLLESIDLSVFGRIVYSENRDEIIALFKGENK
jgi:hypothetical protein